ncbi:hypothetical protein Sru01_01530 [Sphaerisporangium rufum]|uniref:ATP-binding protein n=1 Tax=Sphaerisporangium rufum TaxID=1381558 RepID=A0A919QW06_9ACTN|nr:ATP-binding protein [Sphaerisporangium rufum]GII75171.1 hypothetical protein Sru01_01530 [Sphaerisporangium rufum]
MSLWLTPDKLCVRVTDHGSGRPQQLDLGLDATHGRGMPIVAALATTCGVLPLPCGTGKTVWARWHRTHTVPSAAHGQRR